MHKKSTSPKNGQTAIYREMLLSIKTSTLAGLDAKAEVLTNPQRTCEEDQAQHSLSEAVSLRLNGLQYMQLRQIQEALDRLQLGDYGICLSCEEPIPLKRLKALPWAKYCVPCQEKVAEESTGQHEPLED
jgi:DnaK suppressor protein